MRLDLNGKSINAVANGSCSNGGVTHFIRVKSGGDLTITDTSDDKSGCITATYGANSVLEVIEIMSDGKLTLADGKIQNVASTNYGSSSVYVRDGGTFILNGGTATAVKPNASKRAYAVYNAGAMKMLSGSIVSSDSSTAAVTQSSSSPLEISGGNIDSANKMFISASQGKAVPIISGGQFSGALKVKWIAECAVGINNETGSTADKAAPETYNACINSKLYFTGETDADEAVKALASRDTLTLRKTPGKTETSSKFSSDGFTVDEENFVGGENGRCVLEITPMSSSRANMKVQHQHHTLSTRELQASRQSSRLRRANTTI